VQRSIQAAFIEQPLARINANIKAGDPMEPDTNFGALISAKHRDQVLAHIDTGKKEGALLLCGGEAIAPPACSGGFFVAPTVFSDCHDGMTIVKEEIFGPVMSVLVFDTEAEVIERANATQFGLAAGVFTRDAQRGHRVLHQLQAGICWLNAYGNSPVEMPVGGYKQSGIGRENGLETLKAYTQTKSIYVGMSPIESPF